MSRYQSKDFARVGRTLKATLPERLIHRQVTAARADASFSAERKHPVHLVDLPSRTLSLTVGGLVPGGRSGRHRHNYETILYVLKGEGVTVIEDQRISWRAGDAVYIPVWAWHHHENASSHGPCEYLACENAPLLQNLGEIALREEADGDASERGELS
jgi:gentisate 1,2-dioxygenase